LALVSLSSNPGHETKWLAQSGCPHQFFVSSVIALISHLKGGD
jgi:hypothetical protein